MKLKVIHLPKTSSLPEIVLNPETGHFSVRGRSMPEDALKFYLPIVNWCQNYTLSPADNTILQVEMEYFNSSTAKQLLILFETLSVIKEKGENLRIQWVYDKDDDLIRMKGEEFRHIVGEVIELVGVER